MPPKKKPNFEPNFVDENELNNIDILSAGELFGEIGVLTNMVRTASVITRKICHFNTLDREAVQVVKKSFPSIFYKLYQNMQNYRDEDMTQRI